MTAAPQTTSRAEPPTADSAMDRTRRRLWPWTVLAAALLLAGASAHVWYLVDDCPLDLSGDEAHYWEWSRRLDFSYYSKGPLVAWIIAAGRWLLADWSRDLVGNEMLAVRLPAVVLGVLTGFGIFVLAQRCLSDPRLAFAAAAIPFTIPILAVGSTLMTIDAPLACLYVWMLVALEAALRTERVIAWVAVGLLLAAGILAKYTMVLAVPTVLLACLIEPAFRGTFRRRGIHLAAALALAGFAPILLWNLRHDWVSFRHVAAQAGLAGWFGPEDGHPSPGGWAIAWLGPADMIGGQIAVVGPVWFAALLTAVVALFRRPTPQPPERHNPAALRLLLSATVVPWIVFGGFSLLTKVQPNWPVLALLPGMVVLAAWLGRLRHDARPRRRRLGQAVILAGATLGGALVVLMHRTDWCLPLFAWLARTEPPWNETPAARYDPSVRLRGWSQLGAAVGRVLERERNAGRDPFLVTDDYQLASQIAFYTPGQPTVYCIQAAMGKRQSQYDLWRPNPLRDPATFVGRPCVYVGVPAPELTGQSPGPPVFVGMRQAELVEVVVRGHTLRIWPVYTVESFAGLPESATRRQQKY